MKKEVNARHFTIKDVQALLRAEEQFRGKPDEVTEQMAWATGGTSYAEIADSVKRDKRGPWATPLDLYVSRHRTIMGAKNLCRLAEQFLENLRKEGQIDCDILSIESEMTERHLNLKVLVRVYKGEININDFFKFIGEDLVTVIGDKKPTEGKLIVPEEIADFSYTDAQIKNHERIITAQNRAFEESTKEIPFLNRIDDYTPVVLPSPYDHAELIYDLKTKDMQTKTVSSYETFDMVFKETMRRANGTERYQYNLSLLSKKREDEFMTTIRGYVQEKFINTGVLPPEDFPALMDKLHRSLYQLYIIQDFIDDPNITDINITGPDVIRVRIKGKTYLSNVHFVDAADYNRFIDMVAVRNGIKLSVPEQTFTDKHDENYILRFSLTAAYVNSVDWPYLHIRKISRHKLLGPELKAAGMFDDKIEKYLLDCGLHSRGVVFAGSPGSGKTIILNWFLEKAYEDSADILVIQENEELFAYSEQTPQYRKGVKFQHVVNYSTNGEKPVSLEELGQLALVAGANVFIIGEAKGAEICSAITLSNSGCRTAITIHSPSSTETVDKMADLAMRGYASDYDQAKRMLKSFQTIVYLKDFKVQEISEITGYDESKHDMTYRYIYRRGAGKD